MRTGFSAGLATAVMWMAPALAAGISAAAGPAEKPWSAVISPENSLTTTFLAEGKPAFHLSLAGWGPQWAWIGLQSERRAGPQRLVAPVRFEVNRGKGQVIDVKYQAWSSSPREVSFQYDMQADKDVPLTMLIAGLGVEPIPGRLVMFDPGGKSTSRNLPLGRASAPPMAKAVLELRRPGPRAPDARPAVRSLVRRRHAHHAGRRACSSRARSVTLTLTFPAEVAFLARQAGPRRA